jgi:pectate lyase
MMNFVRLYHAVKIVMLLGATVFLFVYCSKSANTSDVEPPTEELTDPQGIQVEPNISSALVKWNVVSGAEGYMLELSLNNSFTEIITSTSMVTNTTYTFDNLSQQTKYYVRIRAIKSKPSNQYSSWTVSDFMTNGLPREEELAFPGALGFGKMTSGGRGGKVIKVTNLNDSGPGSLRDAINQSGKRIVIFEVSGNIKLQSRLVIRNGDLTIAGQSAPGDGICIQNYEVYLEADNVIIRYLRFRLGDETQQETDAIWGRYRQNIIIDHCSMSWSIDECASFYANKNFTMQYCLLAESLNKSFHEKDDHGYGGIWGGHKASFYFNLLAHHNSRNPRFDGGNRPGTGGLSPVGKDVVDFRFNVLYNWRGNSIYGGENGEYNIVNNYFKAGPATPDNKKNRILEVSKENGAAYAPGYGRFFVEGNYVFGNTSISQQNWSGGIVFSSGTIQSLVQALQPFEPIWAAEQPTAEQAYQTVLEKSGASYKRDAVDSRIVDEVRDGTYTYKGSKTGFLGIIDSQTDVGGWPILNTQTVPLDTDGDGMPDDWEKSKGLDHTKPNANGRDLSLVYDNIEVYLNSLVGHLY